MELAELDPAYMTALSRQFGFLGAFLGGVSATFFVTLLTLSKPSAAARWSMGLSATAAVAFIVTASLSMTMIAANHPQAPGFVAEDANEFEQLAMAIGFAIGIYSLLGAIGTSGWMRTRTLGFVTTTVAAIAAIPITISIL